MRSVDVKHGCEAGRCLCKIAKIRPLVLLCQRKISIVHTTSPHNTDPNTVVAATRTSHITHTKKERIASVLHVDSSQNLPLLSSLFFYNYYNYYNYIRIRIRSNDDYSQVSILH